MDFLEEIIGEIIGEIIVQIIGQILVRLILLGIYRILQYTGMVIRLLSFLGNKTPEYLLQHKQLNAFIAVLAFVVGMGLDWFLRYY